MISETCEKLKELLNRSSLSFLILDGFYTCLFAKPAELINVGETLNILEPLIFMNKTKLTTVSLRNEVFCARIIPVDRDNLLCILYSKDDIFEFARKANIYNMISDPVNKLDESTEVLWNQITDLRDTLKKSGQYDIMSSLIEAEKSLNIICSVTEKIKEFVSLHLMEAECELIEVNKLISDLVYKCNIVLQADNKYVHFVSDNELYFIKANTSHVMLVLVELLQYSIKFYSDKTEPFVIVYKTIDSGKSNIVVKIVGDFPCQDQFETLDVNSVKDFAAETGGTFEIKPESSRMAALISIPEYVNESGKLTFSSNDNTAENEKYLEKITNIFMRAVLNK